VELWAFYIQGMWTKDPGAVKEHVKNFFPSTFHSVGGDTSATKCYTSQLLRGI